MLKKFSWVFIETVSTVVFQFLSIVILARMLTPRDYGILGMMIIFIALGNMIVDSGMGSAIVRKEKATETDYSTLFIYNLAISGIIYAVLVGFAGFIADFYKTPELISLIKVLSFTIVISALGVIQNARLVRALKFRQLAIVAFVSNLGSLALAIVLAGLGFGVWALIYQQLCLMTLRVVLLFAMARFIPSLSFSPASFKYQFNFGVNVLMSNILNTIFANISSSIIPKIGSAVQNGYYVQASKLQNVPVSILTTISDKAMFPILAQYHDEELFKKKARTIIRYTALIAFPAIFFCSALSKQIVLLLLGNKWIESSIYLEIIFFAGIGICIQYYGKNLFKSFGDTRKILHLEAIKTSIGLAILFISFNFGLIVLMYGIVIASIVSGFITMSFLRKYMKYPLKQHFSDLKEAFLLSVVSYAIIKVLNSYFLSDTILGLLYFALGFVIYAALGMVTKNKQIEGIVLVLRKKFDFLP